MLRKPRPLPERFNRPVTSQMRLFAEKRLHRRRDVVWKRWQRMVQRWQRQAETVRRSLLRFFLIAVPAAIVVGIGFLLYSPVLHIKEIEILLTDPRINVEEMQHGLSSFFGRHLFFLSLQEAEDQARATVPDVKEVSIMKQYPSTLVVRLTFVPIIARLLIEDPNARAGSGAVQTEDIRSDFLTEDGMYVTYHDPQVQSGSARMELHIVDWGVRPTSGAPLLDPELLLAMHTAETVLQEQFDRTVTMRTIFLRAREFHMQTPDHTLWFDVRTPVEDQLERYRTFLETEDVSAAKRYVDLRLVDKVVYQ